MATTTGLPLGQLTSKKCVRIGSTAIAYATSYRRGFAPLSAEGQRGVPLRGQCPMAGTSHGMFGANSKPYKCIGGRKVGIVWFRNDLRLHDHEALSRATAECSSMLPVYCFDPREYGESRPQRGRKYGKTGPYRATFLIDAVTDLRERLRQRGSDLVVAVGKPEDVIPEIGRKIGADAVYCHTEVTYEETQIEDRVKSAVVKDNGGAFHSFWTNTLHHVEDLPCGLEKLPQSFDEFKSVMEGVEPRHSIDEDESIKGLPLGARMSIQMGEIPTLEDLGFSPPRMNEEADEQESCGFSSCQGGESEALKQLRKFVQDIVSSSKPGTTSFSGSIAPWLASGCLSPRKMLETVMQFDDKSTSNKSKSSLNWIQFELLWRDFFRMLTKRYTDVVLPKARHVLQSQQQCVA
ncbi:Blue-light photoreceptor PHR2 [Picochlorum sp. SENEW3]|nr:Blue-light photoreceptor PHR2 [Picochlorum sp. SENEW3]